MALKKIKLKRGLKASLPTLDTGEPAFTTDGESLFIGNGGNNVEFVKKENLAGLDTAEKGSLVGAVNELVNTKETKTEVSKKANKLEVKSLISNGNFDDGTGWTSTMTNVSYSNNEFYGEATAKDQALTVNMDIINGHTNYMCAWVKADDNAFMYMPSPNKHSKISYIGNTADWTFLSSINTHNETKSTVYQPIRSNVATNNELYVKQVTVLDLTEIFGAGNEPSQVQMDTIMNQVQFISNIGQVYDLPALIKWLLNSDSGWQELSLINNWNNVSGYELKIRRVGNVVMVKGRMNGTSQTDYTFARLPVGYRPQFTFSTSLYISGTSLGATSVFDTGQLSVVSNAANIYVDIVLFAD